MKITLVRLSVLALSLTGFAASTVVSYSQTRHQQAAHPGYVCGPAPMCPPSSGGGACGW